MAFRNLDGNHDWLFGQGLGNYVTQSREIALNAETRVLSFLGDCFFAVNEGINWWNLLDYNKQEELENAVSATIAATPGIEKIESVELVMGANRRLTIEYTAYDIFSTAINGVLPLNTYGIGR